MPLLPVNWFYQIYGGNSDGSQGIGGGTLLSDGNCAQAVLEAFGDVTGLEKSLAAKLASSFGGGMGRMREVCGAVSGMLMVAGLLYGYDDPGENDVNKKAHYRLVQTLAGQFREEIGSIICREILATRPPTPTPRPARRNFTKPAPAPIWS